MKSIRIFTSILILSLLFASCKSRNSRSNASIAQDSSLVKYAEFMQIKAGQPFDTLMTINNWESKTPVIEKHALVPRDCVDILSKDIFAIPVPVESVVSMSTTFLPFLKILRNYKSVKALSGTTFVYDSLYREMISRKEIYEVGAETAPDYEKIISLSPDAVLAYGVSGSDNSYINKLRTLGQRVIVINDYLENAPLAKLEYIKLFGVLCQKMPLADSIFVERENEYMTIKNRSKELFKNTTKVLINLPFREIWYVPGGDNYTSILVSDAGGEILGSAQGERISSQESFEKMYSLGKSADVWINLNSFSTLSQIITENSLYKNLDVFQRGNLYNNIKRQTPAGGSDFWESGAIEPAEILKDLIQIFHPEVAEQQFPERELKYYLKLN